MPVPERRMEQPAALIIVVCLALLGMDFSGRVAAQPEPPVRVQVRKHVRPGRVIYRYRVENKSPYPITQVLIGYDGTIAQPELPMPDDATPSGLETSPAGWHFELEPTEDDVVGNLKWEIDSQASAIRGGRTLGGFSVTLGHEDSGYETGHWTVILNDARAVFYSSALVPEFEEPTWVPPASVHVLPDGRLGAKAARDSISIQFAVRGPGLVAVQIVDAAWRFVARLPEGGRGSRRVRLAWDGRDLAGRPVSAGAYLVVINTPKAQNSARFTWIGKAGADSAGRNRNR